MQAPVITLRALAGPGQGFSPSPPQEDRTDTTITARDEMFTG